MFTINMSQKYLCDYQLINKNIKDIEKNPIQVVYTNKYFDIGRPWPRPGALAFQNPRPKATPGQIFGPAWPAFFWLGLAWPGASGQSQHITMLNSGPPFVNIKYLAQFLLY